MRSFQFLGIPPKGELEVDFRYDPESIEFPISRDPPEGGTSTLSFLWCCTCTSGFQFLGIPPKGEHRCNVVTIGFSEVSNF